MATAESVKTKIQGLIDTANEATGNSDTDLTTAVGALVAGFGQGGGGSLESGELITTTANYYGFTLPVSSKKTHVVIYPKVFEDETHNTGRISYQFVCEGYGQIAVRRGGAIYVQDATDIRATFNDTSIVFGAGKAPNNIGEYYWFAW